MDCMLTSPLHVAKGSDPSDPLLLYSMSKNRRFSPRAMDIFLN